MCLCVCSCLVAHRCPCCFVGCCSLFLLVRFLLFRGDCCRCSLISGCCGSIYNNVVGLSSISCFAFGPSCLHVTLAARPAKKRPKLRLVLIGQAATLEQQGDFAGMRVAQTHGFAHETADALKQNVARNCQETVCRILPGAAAMAPSESGADKAGETAQHAQQKQQPERVPHFLR